MRPPGSESVSQKVDPDDRVVALGSIGVSGFKERRRGTRETKIERRSEVGRKQWGGQISRQHEFPIATRFDRKSHEQAAQRATGCELQAENQKALRQCKEVRARKTRALCQLLFFMRPFGG